MTTILADARLGLMVSDSSISSDDRVWSGPKVFRVRGDLYGFSGDVLEAERFLDWIKSDKAGRAPKFSSSECLMLSHDGLFHFLASTTPSPVKGGIEAIGSGGKAARCAYQALGCFDPTQAVQIVCHHDSGSRAPVRTYKLRA